MKKSFLCDCGTHSIEIGYENITEWTNVKTKKNIPELFIAIYDIYNPNTGRKYKKPKLIADVIFNEGKGLDNVMKFLEDAIMHYTIRKK